MDGFTMSAHIGIDLGGTNIKAGVVDDQCRILATAWCKTALPRPAERVVADMARMAREAVAKSGRSMAEICDVGVGSPGAANPETGMVEYSCNLGFDFVPVSAMLSDRLGKPVFLENDANAAAYGEVLAGAAKGAGSCVCVTLGTGVGGGIVLDGRIYSGFNYAGAELGHMVIDMEGEPCACGRRGCWESYASATALIRQTHRAMEAHPDSAMWSIAGSPDDVDGRTAFDAMRRGDATGRAVVERYFDYLACGLTNIINIFQPEVLCLGGGICKEGDALLAPLEERIAKGRYNRFSKRQTRLCVATLGNDAGMIGAALLGRMRNAE